MPFYATPGKINATTYTFTARTTGDIDAYFAGSADPYSASSTAKYEETLTMLVNGVATGVVGLDDHSSRVGQMLDLGHVQAGATITFRLNVVTTGQAWYSNAALNSDGINHIYSTAYAGGDDGIPAGTYVGFEDLAGGHPDANLNYRDETFVFTDVTTVATTPGQPPVISNPPPPSGPPTDNTSQGPTGGPQDPPSGPSGGPPSDPPPVSGVPEPATWAAMLLGFGAIGATLRRRRATLALG